MKLSRLCGARAGEAPPDVLGDPGSTLGPGEHLASNTALVPGGQAGAVLDVPFSKTCTLGFWVSVPRRWDNRVAVST